ncbi:sugar ABC transporter ATP-binding protein [Roseibium algae]|uniref:Sugar ABC transporter ATP-binding protein n=1 Tax=Roseibium algae TaxID=3123038 RepID=A0ABU8TN06_9HYPH
MSEQHPIGLTLRNATKVYPGTVALNKVDFDLRMGVVNVLVGENGAGKSTMMKVISGVEQLTEGEITLDGQPVQFNTTADAVRNGVGIVFQELNLFPNMSVAENIFIAREKTRGGVDIDAASQISETRALMQRLEQDIAPETLVGELRIGQQQIVEIAKSLAQDARILILDEPTSALSATEVEVLFRVIGDLTASGVGIVYISHRLEELIRIGDYITVLRDGVITGSRPMEGVDMDWIVRNMIGAASKDFPRGEAIEFGPEVFRAEHVSLPRAGGGMAVDDVSFSLKSGEILGIYGLMGAGRSELLECVMAQHPNHAGKFFISGEPLIAKDVSGRIHQGVALIPENRKIDGLIEIMAIRENITLSSLADFKRFFDLDLKAEARTALDYIKRLTIKVASPENPVSSLSGGNQQKVVIGKALMTRPKVLLMDEPSRGIDIGAKAEVFRVMRDLAAQGLGIVFVTSDLDEVMALSDRILVIANGRVVDTFEAKSTDPAQVVAAANRKKVKETAA